MKKRTVINGKVMRTPLSDNAKFGKPVVSPPDVINFGEFNEQFIGDFTSTRARDKALLVSLGVNGEVPLAHARINAGLDPSVVWDNEFMAKWSAANDNELAAMAA